MLRSLLSVPHRPLRRPGPWLWDLDVSPTSVLVTRDASMYIDLRFNAILDEGCFSKISNCLGRLRPV